MGLTDARSSLSDVSPHDLPPGSFRATRAGCTCPVLDNQFGRGLDVGLRRQHWVARGCPLHDGLLRAAAPERGE